MDTFYIAFSYIFIILGHVLGYNELESIRVFV